MELLRYHSKIMDCPVVFSVNAPKPISIGSVKEQKLFNTYNSKNTPAIKTTLRGSQGIHDTHLIANPEDRLMFNIKVVDPLIDGERVVWTFDFNYSSLFYNNTSQSEAIIEAVCAEIIAGDAEFDFKNGANIYDIGRVIELVALADLKKVFIKEDQNRADQLTNQIMNDFFKNYIKECLNRQVDFKKHDRVEDTYLGKILTNEGFDPISLSEMVNRGVHLIDTYAFIYAKGGDVAFIQKLHNAEKEGIDIRTNSKPEYLKYVEVHNTNSSVFKKIFERTKSEDLGLEF